MDDHKICYITCVNNDEQYAEARLYLEHQQLPDGFMAEFRAVEGASSMAAGYNAAMKSSDAKYKLYLHQDLFVVKQNAIKRCIELFGNDEKLGLIGLAGCGHLPDNGMWWNSDSCYGLIAQSICTEELEIKNYGSIVTPVQKVQAVDGIFMMTQYDVPWREDLFQSWHFYDISQSLEFARTGYDAAIPHEAEPWCVHETAKKEIGDYHRWREVFLQEYAKEIGTALDLELC